MVHGLWNRLRNTESGAHFASVVGANFATLVLSIGVAILSARILGAADRGVMAGTIVWVSLAGLVGDLGINQSIIHFGARSEAEPGKLAGTVLILTAVLGCAIAALGTILLAFLPDDALAACIRVYLWSVPAALSTTCIANLSQGIGGVTRFNVLRMLRPATLLPPLLLFGGGVVQSMPALFGTAAACEILLALGAMLSLGRQVLPVTWRFDRGTARNLIAYGGRTVPGNVSWFLNQRLDQAALSVLVARAELGIYAVVVSYAGVLFQFSLAFSMVGITRFGKHEDAGRVLADLRRMRKVMAILVAPLAAMMAVVAPWVIPWVFGKEYDVHPQMPALLVFAAMLLGYNYLLSVALRALGRPSWPSLAEVSGLLFTVAGVAFWVTRTGALGAAQVTCASAALIAMILTFQVRRIA